MAYSIKHQTLLSKTRSIAKQLGVKLSANAHETAHDILDKILAQLAEVPHIPFPVSFSTVDIVPLMVDADGNVHVLLGRKFKQTLFQFCGGFRDAGETNVQAACREFEEEASLRIPESRMYRLGEMFIDDNRYKASPHKITTTVFRARLLPEEISSVRGNDDIEEVKFFTLEELLVNWKDVIRPVHHELFRFAFREDIEAVEAEING